MGNSASIPNAPIGTANQNNPEARAYENPCSVEFDPNGPYNRNGPRYSQDGPGRYMGSLKDSKNYPNQGGFY